MGTITVLNCSKSYMTWVLFGRQFHQVSARAPKSLILVEDSQMGSPECMFLSDEHSALYEVYQRTWSQRYDSMILYVVLRDDSMILYVVPRP